jgi:hypothetical protein
MIMLKPSNDSVSQSDGERPRWATPAIWVLGLTSAGLVVAARHGYGTTYLDQAGKAVYWTAAVFVPLLAVNRDVLCLASAKRWLALMLAVQILLIYVAFDSLTHWSFLTLTPVCMIQIILYCIPLGRLGQTK